MEKSKGKIFLDNEAIEKKKDLVKLRKKLGLVFQDPDDFFIASTVYEELSFGLINNGIEKDEIDEKINKSLEFFGIEKLKDKCLDELSGGQKKLVSIAALSILKPELLIFDEPTSGVDEKNILSLKDVLEKLENDGTTLLISSHNLDFIWSWADRILVLEKGRLIYDGDRTILTKWDFLKEKNLGYPYIPKFMDILGYGVDLNIRTTEDFESFFRKER